MLDNFTSYISIACSADDDWHDLSDEPIDVTMAERWSLLPIRWLVIAAAAVLTAATGLGALLWLVLTLVL